MYVCDCCGKAIDELSTKRQCHGYTSLGDSLDEEYVITSCSCGGEFVEAEECAICGQPYDDRDLYGICECCMENYETVKNAIEFGDNRRETIEVNGFICYALTNESINQILTKWCEENIADYSKDVKYYCEDDKFDFSEFCKEKYEKDRGR